MAVRRFISKGKGRKRRAIPLNKKKKGVSVRSVSLRPTAIGKINKEQIKLLNKGQPATFSKALNSLVMRAKRAGVPIYDTHVNTNERRKPYHMWISDMKKHKKVKGSDTIVMADSYGQAVDDFVVTWNKDPERMQNPIGYPVVQGTGERSFRYKRDLPKNFNFVHSYVVADRLGIDTDGFVGTYTIGTGKNIKIVGYTQGQTFTQESISHIDPRIKKYHLLVPSDFDSQYPDIFAINNSVAKRIAEDMLKDSVEFKLFRVDMETVEVK